MVDRPSHTQLWAFVVDSLHFLRSRNMGKRPVVALSLFSIGILCLDAYTKHVTTNMTIAKQNVDRSTYIPISNVDISLNE